MRNKTSIQINILIGILLISLLASCFKEDDIVLPHEQGDIQNGKIILGETYPNQVFYDLSTNAAISANVISDWDLAFECDKDSWHIILNAAQMMYAGNSKDTDFANVTSSDGLDMLFDKSDGNMDSTSIGDWYYFENDTAKSYQYVYVIDRGMDENSTNIGAKKITIDIVNNKYFLRYADLNGDNEQSIAITKNDSFRYVYFSFGENGMVNIAPTKETWSLKFSKYATMLKSNGEDYPYLVTGVLLNPENITVALDTVDFLNISIQDTSYQFSSEMDFIGYDWKYYSFDDEMYSIVPNRNYIIKNYDGFFYKMRFIGFYDENGVKGTVTFEVVKL